MDAAALSRIMEETGPTISVVLLRANGKMETVSVDMTPRTNGLSKLLGGRLTIAGNYRLLNAVLMKLETPASDALPNKHRLPFPHHVDEQGKKHVGDLALIKTAMDGPEEESPFVSLTEKQVRQFFKEAPYTEVEYDYWMEKHGFENLKMDDEDDEEEEEEEESDEEGGGAVRAMLETAMTNAFEKKHGRKPTAKERAELLGALGGDEEEDSEEGSGDEDSEEGSGDEDSEEGEDSEDEGSEEGEDSEEDEESSEEGSEAEEDDEEEDAASDVDDGMPQERIDELLAEFEKKHKRKPTVDEFSAMISKEEEQAEKAFTEKLTQKITAEFVRQKQRKPTEEELETLIEHIRCAAAGIDKDDDDEDDEEEEEEDDNKAKKPTGKKSAKTPLPKPAATKRPPRSLTGPASKRPKRR